MATVVDTPTAAPGACFTCGVSSAMGSRTWWMDIEKYAEDWGNIYFCDQCFKYFIYEASQSSIGDAGTTDELATLQRINADLRKKVALYESVLRPLIGSGLASNLAGVLDGDNVPSVPQEDPTRPASGFDTETTPSELQLVAAVSEDAGRGESPIPDAIATIVDDIPVETRRDFEPFDDPSLGSLPIIASEFGVDESPDTGFSLSTEWNR